jgi:flagellar hook-associated protein 3 FlgL
MRIDPESTAVMLEAINRTTLAERQDFQQMSTGLRVNVPSDDPAAAAENVGITAQLSENDQYLQNISSVQSQLQTADSTLSSVITSLSQAISLGVEGANNTLNTDDRNSIAQQVSGIQQTVLGLANTSFAGTYLFAGTNTTTQPFVADSTSASGVAYKGNSNSITLTVTENKSIAINVPGSQLFAKPGADVFAALNRMATSLQANDTTGIQDSVTSLRTALDNVTAQRTFYGNTLNELDSDTTYLNDEKVQLQTQQNNAVGADMATTVSEMMQAETAQSATLEAASKIMTTSLLDYLK